MSSNKPYAVYFEDALLREYGAAFRDLRAMSVLLTVIAIVAVTAAAHNQAWLAAEQRRVSLGVLRTLGFTSRSVALYLNLRALGINLIGYGLAYFSAQIFIQGRLGGELHSIAGNQLALSIEIPQALLGLLLSSAATWMGTWISSRRTMSSSPAGLIGRGPGAAYS